MNKNIGFALLFLLFSLSLAGAAFAQAPVVGVSPGDTFTYNCTLTGSHNGSLTWDPWMPERNQSTWKLTVTDVNSTKVTFQLQILLANGTEELFPSQFVDIFSGGANGLNYMFFVGSNLNVGGQVYPGGSAYTVNDTVTRTYVSGQRQTNHVNFASVLDVRDVYIDKTAGVLVEVNATTLDLAGTFTLKLVNSSLWTVSTLPTATPLLTSTPAISPTTTPTTTTSPTTTATTTPTTTAAQPSPTIPEFSSIAVLSIIALAGLCAVAIFKTKKAHG